MSRVEVADERYQKALTALNREIRRVHGPDAVLFGEDGTRPDRVERAWTLTRLRERRSLLLQLASHSKGRS